MSRTIKHALIVCHPAPESFVAGMAARYARTVQAHGQDVVVRDLYRLGFDPVLEDEERHGHPKADVPAEWAALGKPDVFVLVYPIWFGTPPAMLKGYIDRVFGAGRMFGLGGEAAAGSKLEGTRLVSLTSSGAMRAWLGEKGVLGSLRTVFDRYLSDVFGFTETARYHFDGVGPDMTAHDAERHLLEVDRAARDIMARLRPAWNPPEV